MNVKFYKVGASGFVAYNKTNHEGIFVYLTAQATVNSIKYKPGLYFGGSGNEWEYLTNDSAAISDAITTALAALDGTATIASASNNVVTIKSGVVQTNGEIANNSGTDIVLEEVAMTGAAADVSIADAGGIITATTVEGALQEIAAEIDGMDGSHTVTAGIVNYSGNTTGAVATKEMVIKGATESDGIISTNSNADATLYFTKNVTDTDPLVVKSDIGSLAGAMHFKDTVDGTTKNLPSSGQEAGDVYIVSVAGTYASQACEVGDMIIWNGTDWTIVTGENQVTDSGATITAGAGSATTLATVDGVDITAQVNVTAGSATIATVSNNVVTITPTVSQAADTGTIQAASGTAITLEEVAMTGAAADVSIADSGNIITATTVEGALQEIATEIDNMDATVDADVTTGDSPVTQTTPNADFTVLNSVTEANGKLVSGEAYNLKKVAATADADDMTVDSANYGGSTPTTNLQTALDNLSTAVSAAAAAGVLSIDTCTGALTLGNGLQSTQTTNGALSVKVKSSDYVKVDSTDGLQLDVNKIDSNYTVGSPTNLATVDTVTAALGTLDATVSQSGQKTTGTNPTESSVDLTIVETDGKLTSVDCDLVWIEDATL